MGDQVSHAHQSLERIEMESLNEAAPAAVGAIAGGGGVIWLAKILFNRMINQYDKKHESHEASIKKAVETFQTRIDFLTMKLSDTDKKNAVLENEVRNAAVLRTEMLTQVREILSLIGEIQGRWETKYDVAVEEMSNLRVDVHIAHERIRLIATGETDFSKIPKPDKISRRR